MPNISQTGKSGRSVDSGDLLAQRKRNIVNLEIASKKALGIFKPALYSRSFDVIFLQSQNGLDEYLNAGRIAPNSAIAGGTTVTQGGSPTGIGYLVAPPANDGSLVPGIASTPVGTPLVPSTGTPVVGTGSPVPGPLAPASTGVVFSSPLDTPSSSHVFPSIPNSSGVAYYAAWGNGTWVVCGYDPSANPTSTYYGPNLTQMVPLNLFSGGGYTPFVTYQNNTWVLCNKDRISTGYNVYYGTSMGNLRALPIFGFNGTAYYATYGNGQWVICGEDKSGSGYNVYFGADLANLTPLAIFGNGGVSTYAIYANGQWVIGGRNSAGNRHNVYFGTSLTNLLPIAIFPGNGAVNKIYYTNNTWLICGFGLSTPASSIPSFYYGTSLTSLSGSTLTIGLGYSCIEARYANGIWVLGFNTNTTTNVFYGADLANLTPLTLFGIGGSAKFINYIDGIWAIGGLNSTDSTKAIYYGANIASLTPKTTRLGYFLRYINGLWIAGGEAGITGNNFAYGTDIASTPM